MALTPMFPEPVFSWRVEHDDDDWIVYIEAVNSRGNVEQEMFCTVPQAHALAWILLQLEVDETYP